MQLRRWRSLILTDLPVAGDDTSLTAKSFSRTVRVDIAKLDELMNIVGELVLCHSTISELTLRMKRDGFTSLALELSKAAKGLDRKLNELQKGVMEIRMIPVGQLFDKMSRIVRKISRDQGKKVEMKMFGADTELDKLIIEDISDPIMHIIRNAIDHGIELPEERVRKGKDEKGLIRLSSFQKGNHVVIEVEDDGRGIELDKVKRKARCQRSDSRYRMRSPIAMPWIFSFSPAFPPASRSAKFPAVASEWTW